MRDDNKSRVIALVAVQGLLTGCGSNAPAKPAPNVAEVDLAVQPSLPQYPPRASSSAAPVDAVPKASAYGDKACCRGQNACRGLGECKTDANSCKGKNDCKGKGGCAPGDCAAPAGDVGPGKACCKGLNDCKGKGQCKTDQHGCKGLNHCKGQGGCASPDC